MPLRLKQQIEYTLNECCSFESKTSALLFGVHILLFSRRSPRFFLLCVVRIPSVGFLYADRHPFGLIGAGGIFVADAQRIGPILART